MLHGVKIVYLEATIGLKVALSLVGIPKMFAHAIPCPQVYLGLPAHTPAQTPPIQGMTALPAFQAAEIALQNVPSLKSGLRFLSCCHRDQRSSSSPLKCRFQRIA